MALTKIDDRGLTTPIDLLDSEKIRFGTGNDLEVYTDGSNSYISHNGDGNLRIYSGSAESIRCTEDGSTHLFHNGTEMMYTHSAGIKLNDSKKIYLGTSADLQIYHDGSNSFIDETGTGVLKISGSAGVYINKFAHTETCAAFLHDSAVELYFDGVKKLETHTTGVVVHGNISPDNLYLNDNEKAYFGDGPDLEIYHDGTTSIIKNTTGNLHIRSDGNITFQDSAAAETFANFVDNGAVELYYDNSKTFETVQYGAKAGGQLNIYHQSGNSYIKNDSGNLHIGTDGGTYIYGGNDFGEYCAIFLNDGATSLYFDHSEKFTTTSDGTQTIGRERIYYGGNAGKPTLLIGADNAQGSTSLTNATQKACRVGMPHYTNAEEPTNMFHGVSGDGIAEVRYGGGTSYMNAATSHRFYTAANTTTTSGTERVRIDSDGLKFNSDTAADNALNDYEEGTWTPGISEGTAGHADNKYIKIGKIVHFFGRVHNPTDISSSNAFAVTGLPFAVATSVTAGSCFGKEVNATGATTAYVTTSETINFYGLNASNAWTYVKYNDMATSACEIYYSGTYHTT